MIKQISKDDIRRRIHTRIRRKVKGSDARPRLAIFRSVSNIYAQVIDDMSGTTLASAASTESSLKTAFSGSTRGGNVAGAKALGKTIAERLLEKGIKRVVFDRGGFLYHGRIRAVAESAREAGLEF